MESIAAIPSPNEDHDQLWMIVKRTINNVTKRYVEFMEEPFEFKTVEDAFFVDSGLSLDGALSTDPATIIAASRTNPVEITANAHGYVDGDKIRISHIVGMTELNDNRYKVKNALANSFEITDLDDNDIDGTAFAAYASGGESRKATSTIAGLTHLEGESVTICVDGATHPARTVSGGSITLDNEYTEVSVGYGYNADALTNVLARPDPEGSSHGKMTGIDRVTLRLLETVGIQTGPEIGDLSDNDVFRHPEDPMNAPAPMFTGDLELEFGGGWTREPRVAIRHPYPLPCTVLAVAAPGEGSTT